jgi:pyruvate dehydrogenase E1 component alpha subunit
MATPNKEILLDWYRQMVLIRRFEEKCAELYQQGKIGGFLHLYIGQEATGVGIAAALRENDHVITAYRDHGIALALGMDPKRVMAEMMGKRTGTSGGKGGSMHLADRERNFWGGHGIVGGHLPLAAGIALKAKYLEQDEAVVAMMGDGSTNIGYFHESLNLSAVWKLPVVWLVENNGYGMGTAVDRAAGQPELRKRAIGYGMKEGERVDGMNVLEVYNEVSKAIKYASETGPVLMESLTYRFEGHSMGDPQRYRSKDEVARYAEGDPIGRHRQYLIDKYKGITKELDAIEVAVAEVVAESVEYAENSPEPTYDDLVSYVYA